MDKKTSMERIDGGIGQFAAKASIVVDDETRQMLG